MEADGYRAILPANADDLAAVLLEESSATIVSGATDVGLWITKHLRQPQTMVFLSHVEDLDGVVVEDGHLIIGARTSYSSAEDAIAEHVPQFSELLEPHRRQAGSQRRHHWR